MLNHPPDRFWKIRYVHSVPTTQHVAKEAAVEGAPEGNVWLAGRQIAGQGRLGRLWDSSWGGLWFSLLVRPRIPPAAVPALTLVASLSLVESLQALYALQARLKWPNDVVLLTTEGWRKLGGLLTEMSTDLECTEWVVLGIGVNVNNAIPESLWLVATSVSALLHRKVSRTELLQAYLQRFKIAYQCFQESGFSGFQDLYWRQYSRPDEAVMLKTSRGFLEGIARGVDGRGALIVESDHKFQSVWEGELI